MKVFVYGTLKKGKHAHHLLGNSKFLEGASLKDYSLCGTHPAIKPNIGGWVDGELYEVLDQEVLKRLDQYEGYHGPGESNLYERTNVDVNHQIAAAYIYNGEYDGEFKNGEW